MSVDKPTVSTSKYMMKPGSFNKPLLAASKELQTVKSGLENVKQSYEELVDLGYQHGKTTGRKASDDMLALLSPAGRGHYDQGFELGKKESEFNKQFSLNRGGKSRKNKSRSKKSRKAIKSRRVRK